MPTLAIYSTCMLADFPVITMIIIVVTVIRKVTVAITIACTINNIIVGSEET